MSLADVELNLVESVEDCLELKRWIGERRDVLAIDTETGGLEWWREPLRMVVLGDAHTGWAIPWERWAGVVYETLGPYSGETVFHNAKFDLHFLENEGVPIRRDRLQDTLTASHLVNPVGRHGLKYLAALHVDPSSASGQERLSATMRENSWTWRTVPYDFPPYWCYAALDGVLTARLWQHFEPEISSKYQEVYDLEIATLLVLADMERRGARIDLAYVERQVVEMTEFSEKTRAWVEEHYGCSPTANRQVADALIRDGVTLTEHTSTGHWKLDEPVLAGLAGHPLADAVLNMRKAGKIRKSYFEAIAERVDGDVIHATMNPIGARTGRMSVEKPPLQQLPRGSPLVRDAFIPRDAGALISCDFDQIEMRLLAHFASEESMIEAIRSGVDLHSHVAEAIFGPEFTKQHRQGAKGVNFAKVYGAGDETMARTIGSSVEYAREFRLMYEAKFPRVNAFMREVEVVALARASSEGVAYVTAPSGRRHPADRGREYALVNYLIQGTAADVFKRSLVNLDLAGLSEYLVLPVHDEAILDVPAENAEEIAVEVGRAMTDATTFVVPLTASAEVLWTRWGEKYR